MATAAYFDWIAARNSSRSMGNSLLAAPPKWSDEDLSVISPVGSFMNATVTTGASRNLPRFRSSLETAASSPLRRGQASVAESKSSSIVRRANVVADRGSSRSPRRQQRVNSSGSATRSCSISADRSVPNPAAKPE